MGLRPGRAYRRIKRAYSRIAVSVPSRNYVGAAPGLKTRQFNMGNPQQEFSHIVDLVVDDSVQVRDNAIESSRIAINRFLERKLGKDAYFLKIRVFPSQILREKKVAQGAGADRVSQGMSHAFGKAVGRAIQTRPGQVIMSALVDEQNTALAKEALLRARARMPSRMHVEIGTDVKSIGTKPRKVEEIVEKAAEAKEAPKEGEATKKTEEKSGKKEAKAEATKTQAKPATKEEKKK